MVVLRKTVSERVKDAGWQRGGEAVGELQASIHTKGGKHQQYVPFHAWNGRSITDSRNKAKAERGGGREEGRRMKQAAAMIDRALRDVDGRDYLDDCSSSKIVFKVENQVNTHTTRRGSPSMVSERVTRPFRETTLNVCSKSLWTVQQKQIAVQPEKKRGPRHSSAFSSKIKEASFHPTLHARLMKR
eukprot:559024-Hanusia_phi.AAC.1